MSQNQFPRLNCYVRARFFTERVNKFLCRHNRHFITLRSSTYVRRVYASMFSQNKLIHQRQFGVKNLHLRNLLVLLKQLLLQHDFHSATQIISILTPSYKKCRNIVFKVTNLVWIRRRSLYYSPQKLIWLLTL